MKPTLINIVLFTVVILYTEVNARHLVWSDEFDGQGPPDSNKWNYDLGGSGWGNQERQYYTNDVLNARQDGGNLVITATRENAGHRNCWYGQCQYTSARLLTSGRFSRKYGRFEARIKAPRGQGIWPAFWLLGQNIGTVGWPQCGEIDILELKGSVPSNVHVTIHGPGYSGGGGVTASYWSPTGQPFSDDFHVYAVDWSENAITFSVDGHNVVTRSPTDVRGNAWVFDHDFFIILNVAVGGNFVGDPDGSTSFPQSMYVDYVRVYQ